MPGERIRDTTLQVDLSFVCRKVEKFKLHDSFFSLTGERSYGESLMGAERTQYLSTGKKMQT